MAMYNGKKVLSVVKTEEVVNSSVVLEKVGINNEIINLSNYKNNNVQVILKTTSTSNILGKQNTQYTITDNSTEKNLIPLENGGWGLNFNGAKYVNVDETHTYLCFTFGTFATRPVDSIGCYFGGSVKAGSLIDMGEGIWATLIKPSTTGKACFYLGGRAGFSMSFSNGDTIGGLVVLDLTILNKDTLTPLQFEANNQEALKLFSYFKPFALRLATGENVYTSGYLVGASSEEDIKNMSNLTTLGTFEATTIEETKEISFAVNETNSFVSFIQTQGMNIDYASSEEDINKSYYITQNLNIANDVRDLKNNSKDLLLYNAWEGKRWVAFGTSLTDTNNTGAPDGTPTGKYISYLLKYVKPKTFSNRGVSGACYCGHILYYIQYFSDEVKNADLITIEGGINDWITSKPLGEVGDTLPYQEEGGLDYGGSENGTFAGAVYQAIKTAQNNSPNAKIIIITDSVGKYVETTGGNCSRAKTNELGLKQNDYTKMIIEVANYMGVEVIDAGRKSQINEEHANYLIDHIHHTELGGEQYALTIWKELKNINPLVK